jgi:hypothetical protein
MNLDSPLESKRLRTCTLTALDQAGYILRTRVRTVHPMMMTISAGLASIYELSIG